MSQNVAPIQQLLPQYTPGPLQLPPSLRNGQAVSCRFHYTERWRAEAIRASDQHEPKKLRNGSWGVYLTECTPETHDSTALLSILFGGNFAKAPRLWACVVYRVSPDPTGYPGIFPDPWRPHPGVWVAPTYRSGIYPVSSYIRALGFAEPTQTGVQWAWWEP